MRMLFTTHQLLGHFHPLVPIARAALAAGHEVAFACASSFAATVQQAGFRAVAAGFDDRGRALGDLFPGLRTTAPAAMHAWALPNVFVGVYAAVMVPDLVTLAHAWPPDLIVRDSHEYGGCIAAEVLGLPHASVRTAYASSDYGLRHLVADPLARLRELHALPPDPQVAMPFRYLHLAAEPPHFHLPAGAVAPTAHLLRPLNVESADEELPPWVAALPARPTIYATLGTVASRTPVGQALVTMILTALREEPINLVLTVGRDNDPAQWGPQPANVHIAQYIPQSRLLPSCDLVIHHGGFSTVTGALNAGLPMVVLPLAADQPANAACCAAAGVGVVVEPGACSVQAIQAAVQQVRATPAYRQKAENLRAAMAALPGPGVAVQLLERLAQEKQPLLRG